MEQAKLIHRLFTHKENKVFFPHIRQDYIARMLKKRQVLIHYVDGNIAGVIIWLQYKRHDHRQIGGKNDMQLKQIVVHPDYKGSGVGKALFQKFEQFAEERGASNICLSVRASNTVAQQFYLKMGMQVTGTIEWQEKGKPLPGVIYSKRLVTLYSEEVF